MTEWCREQTAKERYIVFPEEVFSTIDVDTAKALVGSFAGNTLMKLPQREQVFFEWLRENDPRVWVDLWDSSDEEPYVVSISFLPLLSDTSRGFPICDLMENDNYYFTDAHIADKEARVFLDSIRERFLDKQKLTVAQTLALEISLAPIDIWHFAYRFGLSVETAKKAVRELVDDNILIHLTNAEHLANFVEI